MALSENPGGGNKRRNHLHQRPIFKCARGDIRFASALEARWASFFGALDVRWSYRPKLYLPEGVSFQYIEPLPQFWLAFVTDAQVPYNEAIPRERGLWVGVSPVPPDAETKERYRLLAQRSGHWVHLLVGEPADGFQGVELAVLRTLRARWIPRHCRSALAGVAQGGAGPRQRLRY